MLDNYLRNVCDCQEPPAVIFKLVTISAPQDAPLLEATIDGLMTGFSNALHVLIRIIIACRSFKVVRVSILIAAVGKYYLCLIKSVAEGSTAHPHLAFREYCPKYL